MVSFSLLTLALATISAYANPTARAVGDLDVSLSSPVDKVASVSELRIVATVKNIGDKDLKILKSGTVLDNQHPTRSFTVRKDGKEADFTGVKFFLAMDHLSEDDWVVIPAGKTVTAEHNVSALYDFSATGPGTFTFDPVSSFQVIGFNESVRATSNTVRLNIANARSVTVTVTDDVSKRSLPFDKRVTINCEDNPDMATFVWASLIESKILAMNAISYINDHGASDSHYTDYFGTNKVQTITTNFAGIQYEASTSRLLVCSDPLGECPGNTAYAWGDNIHICPLFFNELDATQICSGKISVDDTKIRGGTIINMMTIVLARTHAHPALCARARDAADDNTRAGNGIAYSCFAAEAWHQRMCG